VKKVNILILFLLALAICCSSYGCATDKVALDLVEYTNQSLLGIAELEKRALESYASVTGKNYTTNEAITSALKTEVIPQYKRFVGMLTEVRPETEAVSKIHQGYVGNSETLLRGFKMKLLGLQREDPTLVIQANSLIDQARVLNEKWVEELNNAYERYGVKKEKKDK